MLFHVASLASLALLTAAVPVTVTRAPARFPLASYSSELIRTRSLTQYSSRKLHALLTAQANVSSEVAGQSFYTNVTIGTQPFNLIIDTGSSDTWVAQSDFTCDDLETGEEDDESDCAFASTYTPGASFTPIPDENFYIAYADGSFAEGIVGYDTVTIAGLTVTDQEIGLVNETGWSGDNRTSGLVGLAYPGLTSAYQGTDPDEDYPHDDSSSLPYSSLTNSIFFVNNLTDPLFSLALSRNPADEGFGGILTIGGIPDSNSSQVNASSTFTTVPIQQTANLTDDPFYGFYTINVDAIEVDGVVYDQEQDGAPIQYIVDSGTTLNYFPSHEAAAFNAMFDPPSFPSNQDGQYYVLCNATAPTLGVTIGGNTFYHNPADLISKSLQLADGLCISGVQDGGLPSAYNPAAFILGGVFMTNALVVFDVGQAEISFSARPYYASSS